MLYTLSINWVTIPTDCQLTLNEYQFSRLLINIIFSFFISIIFFFGLQLQKYSPAFLSLRTGKKNTRLLYIQIREMNFDNSRLFQI